MAVYDYATTFTQLLQQKYAKELCSDALTQSNQSVKFINAQTIKLPRMTVSGYKDHTRTPGFNSGTLSNDWEAKNWSTTEMWNSGLIPWTSTKRILPYQWQISRIPLKRSRRSRKGFLPFFQAPRRTYRIFRPDQQRCDSSRKFPRGI